VTRQHVEDVSRRDKAVVQHPLGPLCRVVGAVWLVADPEDRGFMPHAMNEGYWEAWITAWFLGRLGPNTKVIDVGANQGYYGLLAASRGCDTIAIEPQPRLYDRLKASQHANKFDDERYLPIRLAIGAEPGRATFYVPPGHGINASMVPAYSPSGEYDEYTVQVEPLDDIVHQLIGFDTSDPLLIKVDVEGAEAQVWQGMRQTWQSYAGDVTVVMEFRWDRYEDPMAFANQLFDECRVTHVDYEGNEVRFDRPEDLAQREHEDWMLVLRRQVTHD